eukprot:18042-Prorocentrum_lima.AAC.1
MEDFVVLLLKGDGSDRAIGLVPLLLRLWGRTRAEEMRIWAQREAGPWDAARKGSSALQEATGRAYRDEEAWHSPVKQIVATSIPWDIQGFYDTLPWTLLLEQGM